MFCKGSSGSLILCTSPQLSPGKINTLLTLLKPTTRPERKDASQMKKLVPEKTLEYKVPISPHPCQQSLSVI